LLFTSAAVKSVFETYTNSLYKVAKKACSEKPEVEIIFRHLSLKPKLFIDNVAKTTDTLLITR